MDWAGALPQFGPFPWLPFAPTYGRRKEDLFRGMNVVYNVHRCPYCSGWHQHWKKSGNGDESLIEAAHCVKTPDGAVVPLKYRTIPIEDIAGPPATKELDAHFPMVDYALTEDGTACYEIARDDRGFIRFANELHEEWLPGGVLYDRLVSGHTILAHDGNGDPRTTRQPIPRDLRAATWNKSQGRCYYCGLQTNPFENFAVDHLVPVADGGTNDPQNLVPSCAACNGAKGAMSLASFRYKRGGGLFWFEIAITGGSVVLHGR